MEIVRHVEIRRACQLFFVSLHLSLKLTITLAGRHSFLCLINNQWSVVFYLRNKSIVPVRSLSISSSFDLPFKDNSSFYICKNTIIYKEAQSNASSFERGILNHGYLQDLRSGPRPLSALFHLPLIFLSAGSGRPNNRATQGHRSAFGHLCRRRSRSVSDR